MIHPSYVELMKVVNDDAAIGEEPVVNSRYSIVCAAAKRARQIIDGSEPMIEGRRAYGRKPLSIAVDEMADGHLRILTNEEASVEQEKLDELSAQTKEVLARVEEKRAEEEARAAEEAARLRAIEEEQAAEEAAAAEEAIAEAEAVEEAVEEVVVETAEVTGAAEATGDAAEETPAEATEEAAPADETAAE